MLQLQAFGVKKEENKGYIRLKFISNNPCLNLSCYCRKFKFNLKRFF